ncbi:MAG TPA: PhoU domain-containing protein [Candidatus Obscuribacterales bacterium]
MRTEAITLVKEDVLSLGRMVDRMVAEVTRLLKTDSSASLSFVEEQEEKTNELCHDIEEKCLDILVEKETLSAKDARTLVGCTIIAAKLERLADHANRVARIASWASEEEIAIPPELSEMCAAVHWMIQDVLLSFLTDDADKVQEVLQKDSRVNYLHDLLSKQLLSDLGEQEQAKAHMKAQFLFCARFLERMGDSCTSIARRVFFIATGKRLHSS